MLSRIAAHVVPFFGRLTVTSDPGARVEPGSILVVNHTSLADPALVLAALRGRLAVEPVLLATSGLWRIPLLGRALTREGHVPVHRNSARAAAALDHAAVALASGRHVMLYAEGRIPPRRDAADPPPPPRRGRGDGAGPRGRDRGLADGGRGAGRAGGPRRRRGTGRRAAPRVTAGP
ncbi:hypothetical protein STANM309S_02168 [Streptomyces tanashiensis]